MPRGNTVWVYGYNHFIDGVGSAAGLQTLSDRRSEAARALVDQRPVAARFPRRRQSPKNHRCQRCRRAEPPAPPIAPTHRRATTCPKLPRAPEPSHHTYRDVWPIRRRARAERDKSEDGRCVDECSAKVVHHQAPTRDDVRDLVPRMNRLNPLSQAPSKETACPLTGSLTGGSERAANAARSRQPRH